MGPLLTSLDPFTVHPRTPAHTSEQPSLEIDNLHILFCQPRMHFLLLDTFFLEVSTHFFDLSQEF